MNSVKLTEEELVQRLKQRQQNAFSYLYDNYSSTLYGLVLQIIKDEEIAQDVLQEVFLKIWNKIESYDAQKGRLFTWMLNITRNASIDHLRSANHRQTLQNRSIDNAVGIIDKTKSIGATYDHIGVSDVLKELPPEQKLMIDLAYYKGYTQEEISKELQLPLGTVKTRTRSALIQLRKILKVSV